jgi:hypothetical protein
MIVEYIRYKIDPSASGGTRPKGICRASARAPISRLSSRRPDPFYDDIEEMTDYQVTATG